MHVPNYIDREGKSGSSIRPLKMKRAFEENGYTVEFISGYGKSRKEKIEFIKKNIKKGIKYDFLYAESSTMPTVLTEKDHIPRYPALDFRFFKFCRDNKIKIGIFYRDIQWKFSFYKESVPFYKRCFSVPLYKYDLQKYRKLADTFYLPTLKMAEYFDGKDILLQKMKVLMPGCDDKKGTNEKEEKIFHKPLNILYVGGVDKIYDLRVFLSVISRMKDSTRVYICCRKPEWIAAKKLYEPYLGEHIKIIHKNGSELDEYYKKVDICCAFAGKGEYMSMAMPVKIFEYMGNFVPIFATKGTVAGDFVEKTGIGWSIEYSEEALKQCIEQILRCPQVLEEKKKKEIEIYNKHTWKARALQVIEDLK